MVSQVDLVFVDGSYNGEVEFGAFLMVNLLPVGMVREQRSERYNHRWRYCL